jgi:protein-L-isoaspartate O-methyltransferase
MPEHSPSSSATVWSSTDYPYQCLKDRDRTRALMDAVAHLVRPGDRVLDIGSGTGILALAAAAAGAGQVLAVELDSHLAAALAATVEANGFDDTINVVHADARSVTGPPVDVVLAEIIDTALADELLVPVMNHLWDAGVVTASTRLLFESYATSAQLVVADHSYHGFTILAPKHEWPFYADTEAGTGWVPTRWSPAGPAVVVGDWDFRAGTVDPDVGPVTVDGAPGANAVLLSGTSRLGDGQHLGEFNSFNGVKILPLYAPLAAGEAVSVSYQMGAGLASVDLDVVQVQDEVSTLAVS